MSYTSLLKLLVLTSCFVPAACLAQDKAIEFKSIQSEALALKGSLSNAWADYDNDGDLDLLVSMKGGNVRLYDNEDGQLTEVGEARGLPLSGDEIRGVSWGDYDNDGDVDILGGSNVSPTPSRSYVFRNENGQRFTEVAEEIGLTIPGRSSRQSNWVDYDNDGDLDLYASNRAGNNSLYENIGGTFKPVSYASGAYDIRRTVGSCWFDYDSDGDLDVFLANQSGDSDALLRNDGGTFVDVAPKLGLDQTLRPQSVGGVGCAIGDYNNDGNFDIYVGTYGPNLLYKNNGDGTFEEVGEKLDVTNPHKTVGAAWGDFDNDGDLDLAAVGYHKEGKVSVPLTVLYENTGEGFKNVTKVYPELSLGDHGSEWVDYDNDGDLDLSLTDGYGEEGGHHVLQNEMKVNRQSQSMNILVLDAEGNFTKAGAEVRAYDETGSLLASRLVSTGGGYNAQSARPVYIGLGSHQAITLKATFMSNSGPLEQTYQIENVNEWVGKNYVIKQESVAKP